MLTEYQARVTGRVGSGLVLTVDDVYGFEDSVVDLWEVARRVR
jgi:hypothetical protein